MTLGEQHAAQLAQYRRLRASSSPAAILGDLMSDSVFRQGSLRLAQRRAIRFDRVVGPIDGLAGVRWRLPWPESAP